MTAGKAIDPISALLESNGEQAQLVRETLEAIPDSLLIIDSDSRIVFSNTAAAELLAKRGLPLVVDLHEIGNIVHVFDPATREVVKPEELPTARALRGEVVERVEYVVRVVHDVTPFWVECSSRPVRTASGKIRGGVVVFRDITERKHREL